MSYNYRFSKIHELQCQLPINQFSLFIYYLNNCAKENGVFSNGHRLKKGQIIVSRKKIAKDLRLSLEQVRYAQKQLEIPTLITTKKIPNNLLITIRYIDDYLPPSHTFSHHCPTPKNGDFTNNNNELNDGGGNFFPPNIRYISNNGEEENTENKLIKNFRERKQKQKEKEEKLAKMKID